MFRTAAAIFAKKTAIVAITGVTVIGGASLALAGVAALDEPTEDPAALTEADCTDQEVWNATDGTCDPETEVDCTDDEVWNATDGTCDAQTEETCADDEVWNATDGTCDAQTEETCADDEGTEIPCETTGDEGDGGEEAGDELVTEHPENHGAYVSEAAKGGGACEGMTGRDKGLCVAGVAQSDAGKSGTEEPEAEAEEEPEVEDIEVEVEDESAEDEGKPADAGPPAGKGGPPAGKGPKG